MLIELIEYYPGLDPDGHPLTVDHTDPVQVLREVEHDRRPDRLSREAGGRPTRQNRRPFLSGDRHDPRHVTYRPRYDDADGVDLVEAGVGRI